MGSIVWTNFVGGSNELTVDWGGQYYKVAPEANSIPSRLQIDVAPGHYTYTASIPLVGSVSRTVDIVAGRVIGLSFFGEPETHLPGATRNTGHFLGRGKTHNEASPGANVERFGGLLMYQEDLTALAR